jgi:hypothetical protein
MSGNNPNESSFIDYDRTPNALSVATALKLGVTSLKWLLVKLIDQVRLNLNVLSPDSVAA